METWKFEGELEVDINRGVIYFHSKQHGRTILRICNLPYPITHDALDGGLDITHMFNASWRGNMRIEVKK